MAGPNGTIQVYNVAVSPYNAVGDGVTNNTAAFNSAIAAIQSSGAPGILYVPPSAGGFLVSNGSLTISSPNIILQGAGGMGSNGSGAGASTIIGSGSGDTITITGMGCAVRDLAFAQSGAQNGSYLKISQTGSGGSQGQITVSNVHMASPYIGVTLSSPSGEGEYWIERLLIEGNITGGGISINVGDAAVNLRHVVMYNDSATSQPSYGIQVQSAGELIICDGTDIVQMGNCLAIVPGQNQRVIATFVSDSLFDSGNGQGCVYIGPSGNGYVLTTRFSNVWASTGSNISTNGFTFIGSGSTNPYPSIQDVSLVNCVGQGFSGHDGLYATNVIGLSVTSSTFGGNYVGINIAAGMSNFVLTGNKCGNYTAPGGNSFYGIIINAGASDHYTMIGNLLSGNGSGTYFDGGSGSNKAVYYNVG